MWMKKAEFGLGNKTIVGSCSNSLRNTNPRGIHHRKLMMKSENQSDGSKQKPYDS